MEASWTLASARFKFAKYDQVEVLLESCTRALQVLDSRNSASRVLASQTQPFSDVDALKHVKFPVAPLQQECWRRKQLEKCLPV